MLQEHRASTRAEVLYSNTVKPASHIAEAAEAGVWRFAADSEGELHKIARCAPGSAVYIRVRVDDSGSVFPLSRKFGAEAHHARALLLAGAAARPAAVRPHLPRRFPVHGDLGLGAGHRLDGPPDAQPAARTASGSRCSTWAAASRPATATPSPPSSRSATSSNRALDELLPYQPVAHRRRARPAHGRRDGGHGRQRPRPRGASRRGLALPRRRRLQRPDGDPADRRSVAVPAVDLARRPRWPSSTCRSPSPAPLRQLRHHVLRRAAAGHHGGGRPRVHRLRRCLHAELRLATSTASRHRDRSSSAADGPDRPRAVA